MADFICTAALAGASFFSALSLALSLRRRAAPLRRSLPITAYVPPRTILTWTETFEPLSHSTNENDIAVSARLDEAGTGVLLESEDAMTSIQVVSVAAANVPEYKERHRLGVGEAVSIYTVPSLNSISARATLGRCSTVISTTIYQAPFEANSDTVELTAKDSSYGVKYGVVAPSGILVRDCVIGMNAGANVSGGFEVCLYCGVAPGTVSFQNINIMELPCVATNATGYYAQPAKTNLLDHGSHGATGDWMPVGEGNLVIDTIGCEVNDPPWMGGGSFTWPIPVAWKCPSTANATNVFFFADQHFQLYEDGTTSISKFAYDFIKNANGTISVQHQGGEE